MGSRQNLTHLIAAERSRKPLLTEIQFDGQATTDRRVETVMVPGGVLAEVTLDDCARYMRFVVKQARLRDDQLSGLEAIVRQLNRRRVTRAERITSNTLIRVAVDLLLIHAERLSGDTEAQLLASLSDSDVARQI